MSEAETIRKLLAENSALYAKLNDGAKALAWLLEVTDWYDARLARLEGARLSYSKNYLASLAKAKKTLAQLKPFSKEEK